MAKYTIEELRQEVIILNMVRTYPFPKYRRRQSSGIRQDLEKTRGLYEQERSEKEALNLSLSQARGERDAAKQARPLSYWRYIHLTLNEDYSATTDQSQSSFRKWPGFVQDGRGAGLRDIGIKRCLLRCYLQQEID